MFDEFELLLSSDKFHFKVQSYISDMKIITFCVHFFPLKNLQKFKGNLTILQLFMNEFKEKFATV